MEGPALRRWTLGPALLLALATGLTGLHPVYEVDAFFQLQLGRAVLEHGSRLVPEPNAIDAFTEPCLAMEWLWGVLLHGLVAALGPAALTWLAVVLGAAAVLVTWAYLRGGRDPLGGHPVALVALSAMSALAIASRVKARPQVLFMVLIPGVLWLVEAIVHGGHAGGSGHGLRRKRVMAGALIVGVVLWAQLHGSFVLAPAIYGAVALQRHLDVGFERSRMRFDAALVLGLLLALSTSAAGLSLVPYLLSHGGGDATEHIREMAPMVFAELSPFASPHHAALFVVWGVGLAGVVRGGRLQLGPLLLALMGLVLMWRLQRFVAAATLLTLPLARVGAMALASRCRTMPTQRLRLLAAVAVLALAGWGLSWQARKQGLTRGPLGHAGWTAGAHPVAALSVLDPGTGRRRPVLTDYRAGPALSYRSEGRIRHYVDGRTPQYFDDTDYAVARTLFGSEDALLRGLRRYRPEAAVVRRRGSCLAFAKHWRPIAIDPMYTTFAPPTAADQDHDQDLGAVPSLLGVAPCGERYITGQSCAAGTNRSLEQLRRHGEPAFAAYLAAAQRYRCRGDGAPLLALSADAETWGFRVALRRMQAEAALVAGQGARALSLIDGALDEGDAAIVQLLPPGFAAAVGAEAARPRLERALRLMDDAAPAALRAELALVCAAMADLECARFQGLRAAARGVGRVAPALQLVAAEHPRAQVRRDATAWLEVLAGETVP